MKSSIIDLIEDKGYDFEWMLEEFPLVSELKGVLQNPEWHGEGDAFIHTRNVCSALCSLPEWNLLHKEDKGILYIAAFFHDVGKKCCTKMEFGIIRSPWHSVIGAKIFREYCYRTYESKFMISFSVREEIAFLIRYHGLPPLFMEKDPIEQKLLKARESVRFELLYLLAKADLLGRECQNQADQLLMVECFKEYSIELGCFYDKLEFANKFTRVRFFQGANVWQGDKLYDNTTFSVFVMSGLPLAGKDTYIQMHFPNIPVVCLDDIREEWGIGPEDGSGRVAAEARERAKVYLRKKQTFIWNATNLIMDTRRKVCNLCENYGARVTILYLEVSYEELLRRNQIRDRRVPVAVIDRMIRKMDMVEVTEAYGVEYVDIEN